MNAHIRKNVLFSLKKEKETSVVTAVGSSRRRLKRIGSEVTVKKKKIQKGGLHSLSSVMIYHSYQSKAISLPFLCQRSASPGGGVRSMRRGTDDRDLRPPSLLSAVENTHRSARVQLLPDR